MLFQEKPIKQMVVLSGKGGTGKTSITSSLVHLAAQSATACVFVDTDVDAANLALVTGARHLEQNNFFSSKTAQIDLNRCNFCYKCYEVCRYNAIEPPSDNYGGFKVNELLCEGCGSCLYSCPRSAIYMIDQQDGEWYFSASPYGPLFHAELFPAAENSGKLVTLIRQQAVLFAEKDGGHPLIIIDGPPGIGCPVIASSTGVDLALLVAEPGVSGIHDLERVVNTLEHFRIPMTICINKEDIFLEGVEAIRKFAEGRNIQIMGTIPYDPAVPQAMVNGKPITEFSPSSPSSKALEKLWNQIQKELF